jgi:lipoprotein-anchoring transpeptidase ErfK/SrfK
MRPPILSLLLLAAISLGAAACSDPTPPPRAQAPAAAAPPPTPAPAPTAAPVATHPPDIPDPPPLAVPPVQAAADPPADPKAVAINTATVPARTAKGVDPGLVRLEVLLARARFSPGVIDGRPGDNLRAAVAAYAQAHGLADDPHAQAAVLKALAQTDPAPAIVSHTITADEVKGPFVAAIPKDYDAMAKLDRLAFTSPLEALAEAFHMDEALLKALNPGADFGEAGATILVAAPGPEALPAPVTAIEVDKSARQVRAFAADGSLLAAYPATVGSTERPAPTGEFTVKGVSRDPVYTYDPARLTFGPKSKGKLTIRPGPNSPVGVVWIDLSIPTYGIHGAPEPKLVGKVASHGCVRLTNWDARQLASAVKPGVKVSFVGEERSGPRAESRAG